jgi:polyphosphate glucokinase
VKVLVVDIGGSHVKALVTGEPEPRRFDSGQHLVPDVLVTQVRDLTADWEYDVISLGYPGAVGPAGPTGEPGNLGHGWVGFDFARAFQRPVRVVNDAVLQALGAYDGGRMLFLGLGTGLGTALVAERVIIPLELGSLPHCGVPSAKTPTPTRTIADQLGARGLKRDGEAAWLQAIHEVTNMLRHVCMADYVVLGGGNARMVDPLPPHTRRGGNHDAFTGGFRLWAERVEPHDSPSPEVWRVVR